MPFTLSGGGFQTISVEQTVQFDVGLQNANVSGGSVMVWTSVSTGINVGSGSNGTANMVLIASLVNIGSGTVSTSTPPTILYDVGGTNQSMTLLQTFGTGVTGTIWLFGLLNPTNGSKTFTANWTNNSQMTVAFASFVNVDISSLANAFPTGQYNTNSGSPTPATVNNTITPTTRKIFAAFSVGGNFTASGGSAGDLGGDLGNNNSGNIDSASALWAKGDSTSESYSIATGSGWSAVSQAMAGHP